MATVSNAGIELILHFEGFDPTPNWPKASSGVTIGFGYDLGYVTVDEFVSDWGESLAGAALDSLISCVGLTGVAAKNVVASASGVKVTKLAAKTVFTKRSLPKAETNTRKAFPRSVELCDNAYSALVSLVFNRGGSMTDPAGDLLHRRKEMREIRDALNSNTLSRQQKLAAIAQSLRSMQRIWKGQGLAGLIKRREAEAALVETCGTV